MAPAVIVALSLSQALAGSACDKPRNDFDGLYCLSKVYQQADADLNADFERLRKRLDRSGRIALKDGQMAWLQGRDQNCRRHEGGDFYVNLACATRMTIARTQFLEDRYRECISSGCMDSRLH